MRVHVRKKRVLIYPSRGWVQVGEVSLDPNRLSGEMEVVIRESGRLIDHSNLNRNDSYESTYTALYEIKSARGKWKIVDGTIMR